MKKLVIFDLDGTLADTSPGILGSVRYTQEKMGLPTITTEQMYSFVGPPMEESYARHFGLSGVELRRAVEYHKEYAMKQGYREIRVYDGILELLKGLRAEGIHTAIATLKAQSTSEKLLKECGLYPLFDAVIGTDTENPRRKSDMLRSCMALLSCSLPDTVLIGDSRYDAEAAAEVGIDFIAVTYGFGFRAVKDVPHAAPICETVRDIWEVFFHDK